MAEESPENTRRPKPLAEYQGILQTVIEFLENNEQNGDDFTKEKQCINDILVDYESALDEIKILRDTENTYILDGYGLCDECARVVCGEVEGWHDHTVHGELSVCCDCSDA